MKRMLTWAVAVLAAAGGGLAVFGWLASRDAAPPDESEFAAERPEVAPEANAFTYFLEATNLLVDTTNDALFVDFRMGKAPPSDEMRELVAKNAECLSRVKRGTECEICVTPPVETVETPVPYVNPWLHMQRMLEARARLARLDGRFADAADDLAVGMRFGDFVQKDASSLIAYLVGVAIFTSSAESAMELARDPAAPPEALAQLAAELETIGPFDAGLKLALKAEHRMACGIVDGWGRWRDPMAPSTCGKSGVRQKLLSRFRNSKYLFKPNETKHELAKAHRRLIANTPLSYSEMAFGEAEDESRGPTFFLRPNAVGRSLLVILTPTLDKLLDTKCVAEGVLIGAKLVVACNRFARDKGRWPETLAELVPDYLSEVPRDPYDGAPFRYSAEKGLVWAVGTNLTDESGSMLVPGVEQATTAGRDRRRAEDFVFELRAMEKAE